MSRRALIIWTLVCTLLLMAGAGRHVMFYKSVPPERIALWFPFLVLLPVPEDTALLFWLFQFPVLAGVFVVASLRFPPSWVLIALLLFYALCSGAALLKVRAHHWPNMALQPTAGALGVPLELGPCSRPGGG